MCLGKRSKELILVSWIVGCRFLCETTVECSAILEVMCLGVCGTAQCPMQTNDMLDDLDGCKNHVNPVAFKTGLHCSLATFAFVYPKRHLTQTFQRLQRFLSFSKQFQLEANFSATDRYLQVICFSTCTHQPRSYAPSQKKMLRLPSCGIGFLG